MRNHNIIFVIASIILFSLFTYELIIDFEALDLLPLILLLVAWIPSAVLIYHLRKGIREEDGIIHFPFVFGNAKLIRHQIQGFDVERRFWERLGDYARLTIHFMDGQQITFLLPDYMVLDIVRKRKILQS